MHKHHIRTIVPFGIKIIKCHSLSSANLRLGLLVVTVLFAFLTIQVDGSSILDFLYRAACFLFLCQQYYEWRLDP